MVGNLKKMKPKTTSNTSQKVLKTSNKYILAITLVMLLLTTGTMAQNITSYLPSNGLVGWWPFNGNANDESGNGNDGTVNGASLTTDRFENSNSAFQSGQLTPLVSVPNININSGSFTCSYWVKYSSNPINTSIADVSHEWIGNGTFTTFRQLNSNIGFAAAGSNGVGDQTIINSNNSIDTSTWNHIVVMRSNQLMEIWVNGLNVASDYLVQNGSLTSSNTFYIGGDPGNTALNPLAKFNGKIDDIGIWNRTLTAEEIQQLYTINACTFTIYDTITVTQTVYDTVTTFTSVTDTLIINTLITELTQPANTNTIKVFPNPAGSVLTIDYGNFALMNDYQLRIENSLGQQVFQTNINQESETLTLNNWGGNGLYFVHIIDPQGNTINIRKIVLQ